MKAKSFLALVAGAFMFLAASQASAVTLAQTYYFPGLADITTTNLGGEDTVYYELVNTSNVDLYTKVTLQTTDPLESTVRYNVYLDTAGTAGASGIGTLVTGGPYEDELGDAGFPFFNFIMAAGTQYVLELSGLGTSVASLTTQVSNVPLPGAIWLFGSALLGFLGFSARRKV